MPSNEIQDLREKILRSERLSETEKKEWIFLLSKMNPRQMADLDRILAEQTPIPANPVRPRLAGPNESDAMPRQNFPPPAPQMDAIKAQKIGEIKVTHPQKLTPPQSKPVPPPSRQKENVNSRPSVLADLRLLRVENLRQEPSVYVFLEKLGQQLADLRKQQGVAYEDILAAFESSPLYRAYLETGLRIMDDQKSGSLTHEEFEAMADFRGSLRKLAVR